MFPASVLARRIVVGFAVLAGAAVVALSWTLPEPPVPDSAPAQQIAPISYERCVQQGPPSYGTRSLNNPGC